MVSSGLNSTYVPLVSLVFSSLDSFTAAYSVVDSYLSSLPNKSNMTECAAYYSNDIANFGLCDTEKLDSILNYNTSIENN